MKRIIFVIICLFFVSAVSYGAAFSPTLLRLSASPSIQYDFDGSKIDIPLTVTGTPATVIFFVYTLDKGEKIGSIRNGYLGWHYVNKIDTCIYMSTLKLLDKGKNTISWDGKDIDGGMVPAGVYRYYFWGFDSVSEKKIVSWAVSVPQDNSGYFETHDSNDKVLNNPIYYPNTRGITQVEGVWTRAKWVIGGDPSDSTLVETTYFPRGNYSINWGKICPTPGDHSKYFMHLRGPTEMDLNVVMKYTWVPNGQSEHDTSWGEDDGAFKFSNQQVFEPPGPISDNVDGLWVITAPHRSDIDFPCEMYYLDPEDGTHLRTYDFRPLWVNPDEWKTGLICQQGPRFANFSNGKIVLGANQTCHKQMIDPYAEEDEDVTVWYNLNGDYVGDRNFEPDRAAPQAWLCGCGSAPGWVYDVSADANLFMIANQYDLGAVSFCLFGPDGTGIGNFAFAGEVAYKKFGQLFVDTGCPYDGMYMDNNTSGSSSPGVFPGLWYVAHNSIKGVITSEMVDVEETSPLSFTVAQNSPNPFNMNTTITFTLAKAGRVTVDVFSPSGQKVDTIADGMKKAGKHSIVWDASGSPSGVYFYTVKVDGSAKTMKMTLLK